jgi:predicted metal-binding membrane protein
VLERALLRDRWLVATGVLFLVAPAWLYLGLASFDMYGEMRGLSAWMMRASWDAPYTCLIFLMWTVMMVGMMLPSAAPAILLFARVARSGESPDRPVLRAYLFALGYLVSWTAFAAVATALQALLAWLALSNAMMESTSRLLAGGLLIAAGAYQLTPLKRACLLHCRGPAHFIATHFRRGRMGALRVGARHGLYCVGCCWALMLLLFAGGVMNLAWIAGLSLFALVEKLALFGTRGDWIAAGLLTLAGAAVLVGAL